MKTVSTDIWIPRLSIPELKILVISTEQKPLGNMFSV